MGLPRPPGSPITLPATSCWTGLLPKPLKQPGGVLGELFAGRIAGDEDDPTRPVGLSHPERLGEAVGRTGCAGSTCKDAHRFLGDTLPVKGLPVHLDSPGDRRDSATV
jgi:hypothetical protein